MSGSLLHSSSEPKKRSSIMYSINMFGLKMNVQDALQLTALKAVCNEPGLPKRKHVDNLLTTITSDGGKWEEILLTFDALSNWKEDKIVSCKILVTILQLLQTGPLLTGTYRDELLVLITSIQEAWSNSDLFLFEFASFLRLRISFLEENPSLNPHFNLNTMLTNGFSLPGNEVSSILPVVSRLLGYQNKLVLLLKLPFKNNRDSAHLLPSDAASGSSYQSLSKNEALTFQMSLIVLYEDAYCFHTALTKMLQFVNSHAQDFAPELVSAMIQQYNDVFVQLGVSYQQLSSECGFDVTPLNKVNPLLQQQKKGGVSGSGSSSSSSSSTA